MAESLLKTHFFLGHRLKCETISTDGAGPYMTRLIIGMFRVHVFYRGDVDPDPHDHPFDFWTFPLVGYVEEVWNVVPPGKIKYWKNKRYTEGQLYPRTQHVKPFRLHFRPASHRHRVLHSYWLSGKYQGGWPIPYSAYNECYRYTHTKPIVTLVWTGRRKRDWCFWRDGKTIPWREYLNLD